MSIDDAPVVIETTFDESIETVWSAITEIDNMRQWYFENIPSFRPEVGFGTQFNVVSGDRDFHHVWQVTEVVPLERIAYDWRYEGYPGDSCVVFELFEEDNSTRLRLTHRTRESFPGDIPEFSRESCLGGWTYFIRERLKSFLAGNAG